jgi:hypothetical protein
VNGVPVPNWGRMPTEEEYREWLRAYRAATGGVTMAEFREGLRRLVTAMAGDAKPALRDAQGGAR